MAMGKEWPDMMEVYSSICKGSLIEIVIHYQRRSVTSSIRPLTSFTIQNLLGKSCVSAKCRLPCQRSNTPSHQEVSLQIVFILQTPPSQATQTPPSFLDDDVRQKRAIRNHRLTTYLPMQTDRDSVEITPAKHVLISQRTASGTR